MRHEKPPHLSSNNPGGNTQLSVPLYFGNSAEKQEQAHIPDNKIIDPLKIFFTVLRYRWLIAFTLILGLTCGFMYFWQQVPMYRASAKVQISAPGARIIQELQVVDRSDSYLAFKTAVERVRSSDLAKHVAFELGLHTDEKFLNPQSSFSLRNLLGRMVGRKTNVADASLSSEQRLLKATRMVRGNLSAELVKSTTVIAIIYRHQDPKYAALVANQVAQSYLDLTVLENKSTTDLARQFINERVIETKRNLSQSERELHDYAQNAKVINLGEQTSLVSDNIRQINTSIAAVVEKRLGAEKSLSLVRDGRTGSLLEVIESDTIRSIKEKLTQLRGVYREKLATLKPGFPEMLRLDAQIKELEKEQKNATDAYGTAIELDYQRLIAKEQALRDELSEYKDQQTVIEKSKIGYTILEREVVSYRKQFEALIEKLNDIGVGAEIKTPAGVIIDTAVAPNSPYSPNFARIMALALLVTAAICGGLIYMLELFNNKFKSPDEVSEALNIPALGVIPSFPTNDIATALENDLSPLSEAYRNLRTCLQFTGTEEGVAAFLVTSSEPGEGKSTSSMKLAADFAVLGRKVLLIDADLRRPNLHKLLGLDNDVGLSNLLTNFVPNQTIGSVFRETRFPGVTFLSAGTIPPNPADILASEKMKKLLTYSKEKYDMIIVDGPPVIGLSDVPILARIVDGTLLLVSTKQASKKSVQTALGRIYAVGGNVLGFALTKFEIKGLEEKYHYAFMQENYYDYKNPRLTHNGARAGIWGKIDERFAVSAGIKRVTRSFS